MCQQRTLNVTWAPFPSPHVPAAVNVVQGAAVEADAESSVVGCRLGKSQRTKSSVQEDTRR
jgi:hypothetical protein